METGSRGGEAREGRWQNGECTQAITPPAAQLNPAVDTWGAGVGHLPPPSHLIEGYLSTSSLSHWVKAATRDH